MIGFAAVAELAAEVMASSWWRATGAVRATIERARPSAVSSSARSGDAGPPRIRLAEGQCDRATVAHELAHVLAGIGAGHDGRFRRAEVDLVAWIGGAAAASALSNAFDAFDLALSQRAWPAPFRHEGDGFVVIP